MKIEEIVDYAMPCMLAEKALKETHQFMLAQQPMKAMVVGIMAIKYVNDMLDAIEGNILDDIEEAQK
jgi:hypothetical protein